MDLSVKKVLFASWGCENPKDNYAYQIYYLILKRIFPCMETFDTKKNYFQFGKDKMNTLFLEKLEKNNYDLILFSMEFDEIFPETLNKMRKISPRSKYVIIVCDDDSRFDSWSRYIALFLDVVIQSPERKKDYLRDNITSFFHTDYNTYKLEPMKIGKKYDVTFVGRPKTDRNEIIKYLMENEVEITLFGWDWYKYPEFKEVYKGALSPEDYVKVINQSKISLNLTKAGFPEEIKKNKKSVGHYNMKARFFEVALCKGFQIIEDYPGLKRFFKDGNEIATFKTREELLEKIAYYLKHEKERERLAENSYKKTITKFNREKQLTKIFTEIFHSRKPFHFPENKKKIVVIESWGNINEKIKDADYITFKDHNLKASSSLKNYILSRALDVTGKPISCCDYYLSSFGLKDYMVFLSKFSFKRIGKEASHLIDMNSIMVRKDFFIQNISAFRNLDLAGKERMFTEDNIAFVSIPLISIKKTEKIDYEQMKKAFEMRFQNDLFSLLYQRKLLINPYPYLLMLKALKGNFFIFKYLNELIRDKNSRDKLAVNSIYIENSPIEKLKKK